MCILLHIHFISVKTDNLKYNRYSIRPNTQHTPKHSQLIIERGKNPFLHMLLRFLTFLRVVCPWRPSSITLGILCLLAWCLGSQVASQKRKIVLLCLYFSDSLLKRNATGPKHKRLWLWTKDACGEPSSNANRVT